MFWQRNKEFRLPVGDYILGIGTPSAGHVENLENYFGVKSALKKSDLSLKLNIIRHDNDIFVPDSMFISKKTDCFNFVFGDNLVHGHFTDDKMKGVLFVKEGLTRVPLTRVFEQILYQAFYTVIKKNKSEDFLIHSSGVIYKGKAFLFIGSSGTGKSTIAALSDEYTVLNDEICLVKNSSEGYYLSSTPFNGLFPDKKSGIAPLAAVFLIAHGKVNRFINIKKSDAAKRIAKEIVPPLGLTDQLSPAVFADMLDYSSRIYDNVPVKIMEFLPDKKFWELIDMEYLKI